MSHQDDAWWRHPRMRLRHDAHLWIRPDVSRWMRGVDPADVFPSLARDRAQAEGARQRARAAEDAELDAFIERERRVLAALRAEQNEVNAELARWRREGEAKYSPSQPRVPAGNPRGGLWTDGSGGVGTVAGPNRGTRPSTGATLAQPMGNVEFGDVSGSSELSDLFHIKPDGPRTDAGNLSDAIVKIAAADDARFYTPDLEEEDNVLGGHTLSRHNERSESSLIDSLNSKYRRTQTGNLEITQYDLAEGTFRSREEASDLVNKVLKRNTDTVDQVAAGKLEDATLEHRFGFVTGKEAYRPDGDSDPYIRPTYSVRVVIRHDRRSWRGYRVHTAFPVNE
jgi:hypothetical protein